MNEEECSCQGCSRDVLGVLEKNNGSLSRCCSFYGPSLVRRLRNYEGSPELDGNALLSGVLLKMRLRMFHHPDCVSRIGLVFLDFSTSLSLSSLSPVLLTRLATRNAFFA